MIRDEVKVSVQPGFGKIQSGAFQRIFSSLVGSTLQVFWDDLIGEFSISIAERLPDSAFQSGFLNLKGEFMLSMPILQANGSRPHL